MGIARILATLLVAWLASATASAQTPVRVILFPGAQNMPMWVAQKNGYFAAEGLTVTTAPTPNSVFLVRSLMKGDHDIGLAAFDNVVAYDEGQGEVALESTPDLFAFFALTRGTLQLVAHSSIATIADLKGKALGVDAIATGYSYALETILRDKGGLEPGDYTLESIGGTAIRARALMEDRTIATMLSTPFDLQAEAKGYRKLANLVDVVGPYQSTVAVARRSWAAAHRDTLVRFTRASAKALDWIFDPAHRAEAIAIYRDNVKGASEGEATAALGTLVQDKEGFARGGRLDPAGMATVLRIRSEFGRPRKDLNDPARYVDESILRDAYQ